MTGEEVEAQLAELQRLAEQGYLSDVELERARTRLLGPRKGTTTSGAADPLPDAVPVGLPLDEPPAPITTSSLRAPIAAPRPAATAERSPAAFSAAPHNVKPPVERSASYTRASDDEETEGQVIDQYGQRTPPRTSSTARPVRAVWIAGLVGAFIVVAAFSLQVLPREGAERESAPTRDEGGTERAHFVTDVDDTSTTVEVAALSETSVAVVGGVHATAITVTAREVVEGHVSIRPAGVELSTMSEARVHLVTESAPMLEGPVHHVVPAGAGKEWAVAIGSGGEPFVVDITLSAMPSITHKLLEGQWIAFRPWLHQHLEPLAESGPYTQEALTQDVYLIEFRSDGTAMTWSRGSLPSALLPWGPTVDGLLTTRICGECGDYPAALVGPNALTVSYIEPSGDIVTSETYIRLSDMHGAPPTSSGIATHQHDWGGPRRTSSRPLAEIEAFRTPRPRAIGDRRDDVTGKEVEAQLAELQRLAEQGYLSDVELERARSQLVAPRPSPAFPMASGRQVYSVSVQTPFVDRLPATTPPSSGAAIPAPNIMVGGRRPADAPLHQFDGPLAGVFAELASPTDTDQPIEDAGLRSLVDLVATYAMSVDDDDAESAVISDVLTILDLPGNRSVTDLIGYLLACVDDLHRRQPDLPPEPLAELAGGETMDELADHLPALDDRLHALGSSFGDGPLESVHMLIAQCSLLLADAYSELGRTDD